MLVRVVACVAGLVVAACGSGATPTSTTTVPVSASESTTTQAADAADDTSPTTTVTTADDAEPFLVGSTLGTVTGGAVEPGDRVRPWLVWDAVPDAVAYTVLVFDGEGRPWWAWSGPETTVVVGGVDADSEIGGPAPGPGVTWVVFANGPAGEILASSPRWDLGG